MVTKNFRAPELFDLHYATIKTVVSDEDKAEGRNRYCGIAKANALFGLNWEENVRSYLGEDSEGNKRKSTLVNRKIRETVDENRSLFPMLNTGIVIVARRAQITDEKRTAKLSDASIINGAQTSGVLRDYFNEHREDGEYPSVNFELIVCEDEDLIAEISIARNFQNKVADLSIYGRKELFDPIEAALKRHDRSITLRKSETDFGDEFLDTEKLIQSITALMPNSILVPSAKSRNAKTPETEYRVYAYRHRARCLKDYATVMESRLEKDKEWQAAASFYVQMAWDAWSIYKELKKEQSFSYLKKVQGEMIDNRKLVSPDGVPDGIVFPMLSALSRFVAQGQDGWKLNIPPTFPWPVFFQMTANLFKNTADHNPNTMGKHADCYISLHGMLEMFAAMSKG
jgi:AIPR protein